MLVVKSFLDVKSKLTSKKGFEVKQPVDVKNVCRRQLFSRQTIF